MSALDGAARRTFAAAASALVDISDGEPVAAAAAPFIARLRPRDRSALGALLVLLERTGAFWCGRVGAFTRLDRGRRADVLARWSTSRILMLRQGAAALRSLACVAHYGSPGGWTHAGYDGPWLGRRDVPVLDAPSLADVTSGRALERDLAWTAQVAVIGSGAGGAAAAARLAAAGIDVAMIEAGGVENASDMNQRALDMLPLLFQEAGLRATADQSIAILQGRGVGGSTLHNTGLVCAPPRAIIEGWRADHGFPHSEDAWRGYVRWACRVLGARPVTPDRVNPNNDVLRRGAAALGWHSTLALHNRVDCCGCGYCMLGCAYNRKLNAPLTTIPSALRDGARILADAEAVRIEWAGGGYVVACRIVDGDAAPTGRVARVRCDIVVLAAGALATPALLRRSGLGNHNVGHGLRLHPAPIVTALFREEIRAWRGLPHSVLIDEFASFQEDGHGGFLLLSSPGTEPALGALTVPGIGACHRERMADYPRLAATAALLHDGTRGTVDCDRAGRPIARYRLDAADRRALANALRVTARLHFAAGADRVFLPLAGAAAAATPAEAYAAIERASFAPHRIALTSVHPQGSCPMSGMATGGAVRPDGSLWDARGIFVADTSVFPTSIGVPPQATTMALAAAIADGIIAEHC